MDHDYRGTTWAPGPSVQSFELRKTARADIIAEQGLLAREYLLGFLHLGRRSRHFLITDETVGRLHARSVYARLREQCPRLEYIEVPEGEDTKSLAGYQALATAVLQKRPNEESTLIAMGGGMVCNLVGMLAATLFRGVRLVHIPTTLMAQCDAAISHKQAINGPSGKNLLGAYYAPSRILVDPDVLATLEGWQLRDGFAEVIKHALAQDVDYLTRIIDPRATLKDTGFLAECVDRNIRLKCDLMRTDPEERNEAMVLQYGHTLGHAVEHASRFGLGHGESVAIGMMFAAHVSEALGYAGAELLDVHRDVLTRFGLPIQVPADLLTEDLLDRVRAGKRCVDDKVYMALASRPGALHADPTGCAIAVDWQVVENALAGFRGASRRSSAPPYLLCGVVR